jgi:hypothetical protein
MLPHHFSVARLVGLVTSAGGGFQTVAVDYTDIPSAIADQFVIL